VCRNSITPVTAMVAPAAWTTMPFHWVSYRREMAPTNTTWATAYTGAVNRARCGLNEARITNPSPTMGPIQTQNGMSAADVSVCGSIAFHPMAAAIKSSTNSTPAAVTVPPTDIESTAVR